MKKINHLWIKNDQVSFFEPNLKYGKLHYMMCQKCNNGVDIGTREMVGEVQLNIEMDRGHGYKSIYRLNTEFESCTILDGDYKMRELLK